MTDFLTTGPAGATATLLLAHGAGAPMDSEFMDTMAAYLADAGVRVVRFEFPYMAGRRDGGSKRPPPKAETLCAFFLDVVAQAPMGNASALYIGGKSMGGRIASLIADEAHAAGTIAGLVCLGYPFHPPGRPERLRTAHLENMRAPALICQGERDPFGTRLDVDGYELSDTIRLEWLADGNHDLAPRKASGLTKQDNWHAASAAIASFTETL
jgi:hypothetical protein